MLHFLLLFILLLLFPTITHNGIKNGLVLLENQVVPSLYPFILLSTCLRKSFSQTASPILLLISLLSGYPIGAKIVSEHQFKDLPLSNQQLLLLCNIPSPSYIFSYVGYHCLKAPRLSIFIYLSILIGNIGTVFLQILIEKFSKNDLNTSSPLTYCSLKNTDASAKLDFSSSIQESFFTLLNISSYILVFNIIAAFIQQIPKIPLSSKALCVGLFEITTGIQRLSEVLSNQQYKLILITGLLSFGGFSVIAQTQSMILKSNLSIKKYMTDKAISSSIAMSVMYGFTLLFK